MVRFFSFGFHDPVAFDFVFGIEMPLQPNDDLLSECGCCRRCRRDLVLASNSQVGVNEDILSE